MNKLSIMLVDTDERYLMPIELKFIEELEDKIDIIVISDEGYLKEYFSTPRNIDILVINENLYSYEFEKHNIGNTFILTEKESQVCTENLSLHSIYKYTSVKKIYSEIMNKRVTKSIANLDNRAESKVFMVYSPSGGSGKTTVAMGIAAALTNGSKKVLYINTESLQSIPFNRTNVFCKSGLEKLMLSRDENILSYLDESIVNETFDYLLPFRQALSSLNIKIPEYKFLIDKIKTSGKYDYIIVDTSSEFTTEKSMLMSSCNKVIIVTKQGKIECSKLNSLLFNIDCSDENKFVFICNMYLEDKENYLIKGDLLNKCNIVEYINYVNEENLDINVLSKNTNFNKIAYVVS